MVLSNSSIAVDMTSKQAPPPHGHVSDFWVQVLERYVAELDISDTQPWLLQQFLRGPEYASYSIVHEGNVVAHADNVAELSCLNYAHVGNPEVQWFMHHIFVISSHERAVKNCSLIERLSSSVECYPPGTCYEIASVPACRY